MSDLKKIRVQHVERGSDGKEIKTDVDVLTDAEAVTMDGKDLKTRLGELINARVGEIIDGAPKELDTLKELADELQKNQSGVSTILSKLEGKQDKFDLRDFLTIYDHAEAMGAINRKIDTKVDSINKKINGKVDKISGKGLSSNDYTNSDRDKVRAIPDNPKYTDTVPDLSGYAKTTDLSKYALKSEVSKQDLSNYAKKSDLKTSLSQLSEDSSHRTVTDAEKSTWNSKLDSVSGKDISRAKTDGYSSASVWQSVSSTRDLEDWIGDFDKRTRENRHEALSTNEVEAILNEVFR